MSGLLVKSGYEPIAVGKIETAKGRGGEAQAQFAIAKTLRYLILK